MAEAVGLGASVIAFVAVAARLSKIVKDAWGSVKDAPEDISRVVERLEKLEYLLNEIHDQDTSTANTAAGNSLAGLWASQSDQLERDFARYQALADKLALQLRKGQGPISTIKIGFHWFLKQDEVRELDGRLQETIRIFETILGLLTFNLVKNSSFDLQELRSVGAQSAESIKNLEPIIEQALTSWKADFSRSLQKTLLFELKGSSSSMTTGRNFPGSTGSIRFDRWYTYEFPFGTLRVTRGVKKLRRNMSWRDGTARSSTDEETTLGIMFCFSPAPWLMAKAVVGTFVLHHRKYSDLPGFTHVISTANVLPEEHQAIRTVRFGKVSRLQELFSKRLATPNDRDMNGESLLHYAAGRLHYEMCALLIREGADCNAVDNFGRTPLHNLLSMHGTKDENVAFLNLHVNNGADPTILNRRGESAFTVCLVSYLTFMLIVDGPGYISYPNLPAVFDLFLEMLGDLEEVGEFDPMLLAMSLCAVHSREPDVVAAVEPAVRKWLTSHGLMDPVDADALRVLVFQALKHRAPELTVDQAEMVLLFALYLQCSVDVIRALVRPGTVNGDRVGDVSPCTALSLAAWRGNLEVVDILLDAGADDQANCLDAFQDAISGRHHHVIERFSSRFLGCEVFPIESFYAVILYGTLDLAKKLIGRVPDVNARVFSLKFPPPHGNTVLFAAADTGDIEKVKFLIESGVDVLARNARARTASASCGSRKDISEYLKQEENKVRLRNKHNGIPNDPEFAHPTVLASAVPRRGPHQKTSPRRSVISPDSGIAEEIDETEPVYYFLDSWGSLNVLTTEDAVLIVGGLCVTLIAASYVVLARAISFAWQNRQYVTVRNVGWVGWLVGLALSLACYIGYTARGKR